MSAPARIAAAIRRFGFARNLTAVAAVAFAALALPAVASADPPAVTIENATNPTVSTADLEGTVDPKGQSTTWRFQYIDGVHYAENLQSSYPPFLSALNGPSGTTSVAKTVTGQLTGLQANTTYHVRLLAENLDGQSEAAAAGTFTTAQAAPLVNTYPSEPVGSETAALDGVVAPRNEATTYWFEWGTEDCEFSACQSTPHAPAGFNEIQQINLPGGENGEGEWNLTFEGQTTSNLQTNPTGAAVQLALEGLSTIGTGNVSVTGASSSYEYLITFTGALADTDVEQVTTANGPNPMPGNLGVRTVLQGGYRTSPKHVSHSLTNLEPETTYHFRLVAENSIGTTETPDREFTTTDTEPVCPNQGMPGTNLLPDCRAYEMVSPPSGKDGADVQAESHLTFSSASGNGVAYATSAGFGDVQGTTTSGQYLARRTGIPGTNGWSSHSVSPPVIAPDAIAASNGNLPVFAAFNSDLTGAIYRSWSTLSKYPDTKVAEVANLYRLEDLDAADPTAQLLTDSNVTIPLDPYTKRTLKTFFVGASQDFSHAFFDSPFNLTTNGAPNNSAGGYGGEFFEYSDGGGVRNVGQIPTGSDTQCDDVGGPACVATHSSPALGVGSYAEHTVSSDGSRVIFVAQENLYMRENGNVTYQLDASERHRRAGSRIPRREPRWAQRLHRHHPTAGRLGHGQQRRHL